MWKVHPATVSHIGSWQEGSASGRMGRARAVMYLNTNLDLEKYEDEEEPKAKHGVGVHNRKLYLKKVLWLAKSLRPPLSPALFMNYI